MSPTVEIPYLTSAQMSEVDRLMVDDAGIELLQTMECAGRQLAHLARIRFLDNDATEKRVIVLAGKGNTGGSALVAGRRLSSWGASVSIRLSTPETAMSGVPAHQLSVLKRLGIPVEPEGEAILDADVVLDGLLGYGLAGDPDSRSAALIEAANASGSPVLAMDLPSGLDATTGRVSTPTIHADVTLTLALPKVGLRSPSAANYTGDVYLADLGVPASVYHRMGIYVPAIFARAEIVRLL